VYVIFIIIATDAQVQIKSGKKSKDSINKRQVTPACWQAS